MLEQDKLHPQFFRCQKKLWRSSTPLLIFWRQQLLNFKRLKANVWCILKNEENSMVVVTLRGSDGQEDHCVTVFGKWIFDSNFTNALPLTKESLDLCCSSNDRAEKFVEVVHALSCTNYMSMVTVKLKKKRKRKN